MSEENKSLAKSEDKVTRSVEDQLNSLTDRNWLFIGYIRKNIPIKEAYKLAGYTSKVPSAPYSLMHKLRKTAELLVDTEDFHRLKYKNELNKLVSLPLSEDKKDVTLSEKLRVLKLFKSSLPDMQEAPKTQFTQIVIKRYGTEDKDAGKACDVENAVDAEIVKE